MLRRSWLMTVVAAVALVGCGGGDKGGGGGGGGGGCSPSGTQLKVVAQNVKFDTDCLAAPAGKAFTIQFENKDSGTAHNVDIQDNGKSLFMGEIVTGPKTTTYQVSGLSAGTYRFQCDVHPTAMFGTFVVK